MTNKIFYDLEFLEGSQRTWWGEPTVPTIDLISIGAIDNQNREFYAVSKDFNLREAWNRFDEKIEIMSGDMRNRYPDGRKYNDYWIRDNVLKTIWYDLEFIDFKENTNAIYDYRNWQEDFENFKIAFLANHQFTYRRLRKLIKLYGKTNKQIGEDLVRFIHRDTILKYDDRISFAEEIIKSVYDQKLPVKDIEFYGYYSAYDHVGLCWLYGKMLNLPPGFPMYTKDLKQMLDERENISKDKLKVGEYCGKLKDHLNYPKEINSHNALADAKWNKELYNFIISL